jgi:hypothetical protein
LVVGGGVCIASRWGIFIPMERPPDAHGPGGGGWTGIRAGLNSVEKRQSLSLLRIEPTVTNMTIARQRIGKHVPEVTLSTIE